MKRNKKTKKVTRTLSLSEDVHDYVVKTGKDKKENRNFSNMAETLIIEAKDARESVPSQN